MRLVIGGTHSSVGKTTIATALMAAFTRRGLRVQPFKVGPDFIDPSFHQAACGRVSRNLDGWMLSRETNLGVFARAYADADIAIIEGVMGLFDGRSADSEEGSTAEMAKWLGAPVLLVVDASAMARSAAALVRGFEEFDDVVSGVLFNRVGSEKHGEMLRTAVGKYCRSRVFGCLPRNEAITLPSRHLGLKMASEVLTAACLDAMADWVERHVDLDGLEKLARDSGCIEFAGGGRPEACATVRIAVARDAAFCFYYQDNLDLLRDLGAELVEFSPIADHALPGGIGGIYLGGGYPELHAAELSANTSMLAAIREFGGPIYAECGGYMYLTEAIDEFPMAGLFPTRTRMQKRLAALGYRETPEGARGHEFRYSTMDPLPEGFRLPCVRGSYVHLHFLSCPKFAEEFVQQCAEFRYSPSSL